MSKKEAKKAHIYRCERCGEKLNPKKMVWLTLDTRTNTYTDKPVPERYSQGGFTFGAACAKRELPKPKKPRCFAKCHSGELSSCGECGREYIMVDRKKYLEMKENADKYKDLCK